MSNIAKAIELPVGKEDIFSLLVDSASIATIFGAQRASVFPEKGGVFEIYFFGEDVDSTKGCKVVSFDPENSIEFEFVGPSQHKPYSFVKNTIKINLSQNGENTKVEFIHGPFEEGGEWVEAKTYFENNWNRWINNLIVLCAATDQEDEEIPADLLATVAGGKGGWTRFRQAYKIKPRYNLSSLKLKNITNYSGGAEPPRTVEDQA